VAIEVFFELGICGVPSAHLFELGDLGLAAALPHIGIAVSAVAFLELGYSHRLFRSHIALLPPASAVVALASDCVWRADEAGCSYATTGQRKD
jgi:hypothetical protein